MAAKIRYQVTTGEGGHLGFFDTHQEALSAAQKYEVDNQLYRGSCTIKAIVSGI